MAEYTLIDGYLETMRSSIRWRRDLDDVLAEMEDHLISAAQGLEARGTKRMDDQRATGPVRGPQGPCCCVRLHANRRNRSAHIFHPNSRDYCSRKCRRLGCGSRDVGAQRRSPIELQD